MQTGGGGPSLRGASQQPADTSVRQYNQEWASGVFDKRFLDMLHMSQGLSYGMFASSSAQFKSGRYTSAFIFQNMGMVETHRPQTGQTVPVDELNIGWVERGEERRDSDWGRPVVSNNFISKHFPALGAHPSALYVIFHSNQYSVRAQLPDLVFRGV